MKSQTLALVGMFSAIGCGTQGKLGGSATSGAITGSSGNAGSSLSGTASAGATVRTFGRGVDDGNGTFHLNWGGAVLEMRTKSSGAGSVSVTLQNEADAIGTDNEFSVIIDGRVVVGPPIQVTGTASQASISVPDGEHTVQLVKRTEGLYGTVTASAATPASNVTLMATIVPGRSIEFIGDSITDGYGVEGTETHGSTNVNCKARGSNESAVEAYSTLTARALGADYNLTAYSGKGVFQNQPADTTPVMPQVFGQAKAAGFGSSWDFSKFTPDVVVILLGTNDFSSTASRPAVTQEQFMPAYQALIAEVRGKYPKAKIVLASSPLLSDYSANKPASELNSWLTSIAAGFVAAHDPDVSFVAVPTQDTSTTGCEYHPSLAAQQKIAAVITGTVKQVTGW